MDNRDSFSKVVDRFGIRLNSGAWADEFGCAVRRTIATIDPDPPIRTLSLFSGAGGLDIGFFDAGFQIVDTVEIDDRFVATLRSNHSRDGYFGDGNEPMPRNIKDYVPPNGLDVDFIIGGPPCQSFSAAGRRAAGVAGINDPRGVLFMDYVRILEAVQPRGFLYENVYGLLGANKGQAWRDIRAAFEGAGYRVFHLILDSADFGVPQHRERLFIVGVREGDFRFPRPTHGPDSPGQEGHFSAGEALQGVCVEVDEILKVRGRYEGLLEEIPPGLNYSFFTDKMGHPNPVFAWRSKFSDFLYKAAPQVPIRTLKAQGGQYTGPFHWDSRAFTIEELKRLQTFPDRYALVGGRSAVIHQLGNSVPPQIARILALAVREQVFDRPVPYSWPQLEPGEKLSFRQRKRSLTEKYRATAAKALARSSDGERTEVRDQVMRRVLGPAFEWKPAQDGEDGFEVAFKPRKSQWSISVANGATSRDATPFEVVVSPRVPWTLGTRAVRLRASELSGQLFTALWKAFEEILFSHRLKADLVQLNGYYQYAPTIEARLSAQEGKPISREWRILKAVVSGIGVREPQSTKSLAALWTIEEKDVLGAAQFLRDLGYEVRNQSTNPEMPDDTFLIPYIFPTLTPQSVQLYKSLVPRGELK